MKYPDKSLYILLLLIAVSLKLSAQLSIPKITVGDIYKDYIFFPNKIENLRPMNDGTHYTSLESKSIIVRWNYATGDMVDVLFSLTNSKINGIDDYEFSTDEKKILISTSKERIYRHSYLAEYYIYYLDKKILKPLSLKGKQKLTTFSPDGQKLAFVRDNNLFITDLETMLELQITTDGEFNKIINGATDWVYEEEFASAKGFAWSPDSKKIAFYRFDESNVKEFSLTIYNDLYPVEKRFKYPKAGEANSIVSIHTYNLDSQTIVKMDIGDEMDQYIGRILWTNDKDKLSILRINRRQNVLDIIHADASTGESEVVYTEKNEKYLQEPTDNTVIYLPDGQNFIIQSERDGWTHFYLYNFKGKEIKQITSGNYDISGYIGYDDITRTLYYLSHEQGAIHQDVFSIKIDGTNKIRISDEEGWNDAQFSRNFKYYILNLSSVNSPSKYILHDREGRHIRIIEDNSDLVEKMKEYNFAKTEFITVPVGNDLNLNSWIIKPSDFDPSKKYPLFMFVYGGPESQEVKDYFDFSNVWFQMLVQRGYIVACVDGRGTDGRGEEFRKASYLQLGKYETIDQIAAARWFGSLPYIDADRIGIQGWSYGGFMSLLCLFQGDDVFKMAISVAPVTNWRFYDSVYTERFMRTPQENPAGYDENSPINHVQKMTGKLLLIHGMADDNVHFQNSVELVHQLIENNKQFDMQFYPNTNHGIFGGNSYIHLYKKMIDFIEENL